MFVSECHIGSQVHEFCTYAYELRDVAVSALAGDLVAVGTERRGGVGVENPANDVEHDLADLVVCPLGFRRTEPCDSAGDTRRRRLKVVCVEGLPLGAAVFTVRGTTDAAHGVSDDVVELMAYNIADVDRLTVTTSSPDLYSSPALPFSRRIIA